jgi:arabinofuranosyltransferase
VQPGLSRSRMRSERSPAERFAPPPDAASPSQSQASTGPVRWGLAVAVVLAVAHALYYWPNVIDDSYITFRYARNFANGLGLVFNPDGAAVEGFSSISWFMLGALAVKLGVHDLLLATKLVGLALTALTTVAVWLLSASHDDRTRVASLAGPFVYALNPHAAFHAMSGMETPLAPALLAAAVVLVLRPVDSRHWHFALWLMLTGVTVTRPEGFGYAGALLLAAWWHHRRDVAIRSGLLRAGTVYAGTLIALLTLRFTIFGSLVPNTAIAKAAGPLGPEVWNAGVVYVARYFATHLVPADLLLLLVVAVVLIHARDRRAMLLLVPVICAAGFSVAVRGDWMLSFRFMMPAAPFLAALMGRGAMTAEVWWPRRAGVLRARPVLAGLGIVVALFATQQILLLTASQFGGRFVRLWKVYASPVMPLDRMQAGFEARLAPITRWMLEHVGPGEVIATGDIGFPAWAVDAHVADLAGLTDRVIARAMPAADTVAYGTHLARRRPDLIVVRVRDGRPDALYDQLTVASGLLKDYLPVDTVGSYGSGSVAVIWRRLDATSRNDPDHVEQRYRFARLWSPRVPELRRWHEAWRAKHDARVVDDGPGAP